MIEDIIQEDEKLVEGRRTNAEIAYYKALTDGPRPEYALAVMKSPKWAVKYARDIMKHRFLEAEPYIKKNADWAYEYAIDVIQGPWLEAEPVIASEPRTAAEYALWVLKKRWKEAEPVIAQASNHLIRLYAEQILHGRFEEAEPKMEDTEHYAQQDGAQSQVGQYLVKVCGFEKSDVDHKLKSPLWAERGFKLFYPVEMEDMHTVYGYNEALDNALLEMDPQTTSKEMWKGEFAQMMQKIPHLKYRGSSSGKMEWEWYVPKHTNYFFYFCVSPTQWYPYLKVFINPQQNGGVQGWMGEKIFKSHKQLLSMPKDLLSWVKSDLKKTSKFAFPVQYRNLVQLVQEGIPKDLADSYARVRACLVPEVTKPEDMHTVFGYNESCDLHSK